MSAVVHNQTMQSTLFNTSNLRAILESRLSNIPGRVHELTDAELADRDGAIASVLDQVRATAPELDRAAATIEMLDTSPPSARVTIPVQGEYELLTAKPSQTTSEPPSADIDVMPPRGVPRDISVVGTFSEGVSAAEIKAWASQYADRIEMWLEWQRYDIAVHNAGLDGAVTEAVRDRIAHLDTAKRVQSDLDDGAGI